MDVSQTDVLDEVRKKRDWDSSEFQQLKLNTQKKIDWGLFKDYSTMQNIDDNKDKLLIYHMELLDRTYKLVNRINSTDD